MLKKSHWLFVVGALISAFVALEARQAQAPSSSDGTPRFKSGVELINVTATVSDRGGRFVPGLTKEDFHVYEDDVLQDVTYFSAERVPVSLGIVVDTSGSMVGEKLEAARSALSRFLDALVDERDEIFLYRFSDSPVLLQDWTSDRRSLSRALGQLIASGGTAMYDAIAEAVPMATEGTNPKKALIVISDGNDTSSHTGIRSIKQLIRESEILVYAVGIDGDPAAMQPRQRTRRPQPPRLPIPLPFPGGRRQPGQWPSEQLPQIFGSGRRTQGDERVNVMALRELTDDSGGRTEIIRDARDLEPATASIADELSQQYYLGYSSTGETDGRWHAIRVEMRDNNHQVRARRGYIAN